MKEIILVKNGELVLKGLNRNTFEAALFKNLHRALYPLGEFDFVKGQSTIMIEPGAGVDLDEAEDAVKRVFGIAAFSRAACCEKDMAAIKKTAADYLKAQLESAKSFKVEARRSDKSFPLKSPEISRELGGYLLSKFKQIKVDVHSPQIIVTVEIRNDYAFIHAGSIKGAGGLPVGTGGRAAVLISGGIDSPVAAYMMQKRGLELVAVHFASPPYTSELAEMKVIELLKKVSRYGRGITTYIVPFTKIQEAIRGNCPEEYFTLIMRRIMMKISEDLARKQNCHALITGESMGQVASQTIYALGCTDAAVSMPVFRPCIGMDKEEIISLARRIDTYDISIQPYEDCCTVFTPRHPKTHPALADAENAENRIKNLSGFIAEAEAGAKKMLIGNQNVNKK